LALFLLVKINGEMKRILRRGYKSMSVLSNIVRERQEWACRQKIMTVRPSNVRTLTEYLTILLFLVLPYAVFIFRDKIVMMIKMLAN